MFVNPITIQREHITPVDGCLHHEQGGGREVAHKDVFGVLLVVLLVVF